MKKQVIWHQHSNRLLEWIIENLKPGTLVDLGSGHNFYINALRHFNFKTYGYDQVDMFGLYQTVADVTKPLTFISDYVLCLEVGEHVKDDQGLLDNICQADYAVLMSWAVPGQEGIDHINCHTNEWVEKEMNKRGFKLNKSKTESVRKAVASCHCDWFRNTLMYYEREESKRT